MVLLLISIREKNVEKNNFFFKFKEIYKNNLLASN